MVYNHFSRYLQVGGFPELALAENDFMAQRILREDVYQSWPIGMGGKKVLKASLKIYIADAALRNAVLMDESILADPVEMGKVVETAVYKHVATFYYQNATSVGYYRGGLLWPTMMQSANSPKSLPRRS